MRRTIGVLLLLLLPAPAAGQEDRSPRLEIESRIDPESGTEVRVGTYRVFEDRDAQKGRTIDLRVLVLPATGKRRPDPIFWLAGGPGTAATSAMRGLAGSSMREQRDIVLVDQRGTGGSNPLRFALPGHDGNLQGYLDPIFVPEVFRRGLEALRKRADLTLYTTPIAMDDLDELRAALGYGKINLMGGSYGTRAALVYLRRHPESARTAVLNGVAPISFRNPLYHAAAAEEGFERLLAEIAADPVYRKLFPDLRGKLDAALARLEKEPAEVPVAHPVTGERVVVKLSRDAFAEALRTLMYHASTNRRVPGLLLKAYEGDYTPFAEAGIRSNRGIRNSICFGMLMSVTAAEDLARIDPGEIEEVTAGTFLGDGRVRRQMAVGEFWPKGRLPGNYGEEVKAEVPVLLLSGTHDPVTPPRWGRRAARHLPESLHLEVPGAHGVGGPVVQRIIRDFLDAGDAADLDTSGIERMRISPLVLPKDGLETR